MTTFNYRWHRGRYKPKVVKRLPKTGIWAKVSDAVVISGLSRSTIARRYLTGVWDSVVFNGSIHVKVPSIGVDLRETEADTGFRPRGH